MNNAIVVAERVGSNQHKSKYQFTPKAKAWLASILTLVVVSSIVGGIYGVNKFFDTHRIATQKPLVVRWQMPVYIAQREKVVTIVENNIIVDENINPLSPDQQYLCNKFGKDCKVALAIFRAESGLNAQAIHVNTNGSVDFGCMQINSIHLKNIDTTKVNLLNCRDNIDVGYKIFQQQGNFSAWSAYNNGAYKKYLIN